MKRVPRHWALEHLPRATTIGFVQRVREDLQWTLNKEDYDALYWPQRSQHLLPTAYNTACIAAQRELVPNCSLRMDNTSQGAVLHRTSLPWQNTVFTPKSDATDEWGRIVRSPVALRPLTLCNYDCKVLTTDLCFAFLALALLRLLHPPRPAMRHRQADGGEHLPNRDHRLSCYRNGMPKGCGILLTDFACAYPSVDHKWIFRVLPEMRAFPTSHSVSSRASTTKAPLLLSMLVKYEATLQWLEE